ncbi:MAG: AAA family ATPase [Flammeovirgaceae bacterium]|nr:AAA family ATPase [Flammeovirgaceae bacterium]
MKQDELNNLIEAIKNSPENIPLRKYLAELLMKHKRYEEAELEFKAGLQYSPDDLQFKIGLAESFLYQGKTSAGLVLVESIQVEDKVPAKTWLIYAKLLFENKQILEAKDNYEKALILDPSLQDSYFESEMNLSIQKDEDEGPEKIKLGTGDSDEDKDIEIEKPNVNFDEVGGMENLKEEIRMKIIAPLKHPEIFKAYGKKIGGGILMYGPPGCGKTHLARATAGEVNANFISVGISDILDLYLGQSEKNLHAIFEKARRLKPSVLFFDEVDALGANRTDMRQSSARQLINQFLSEMDGIEYSNDGVLILAATNAPWHLDPAFRRPGRFDRILFVPPPDQEAREAILDIKLKEKPTDKIDYKKIVKNTQDFSGADLNAIIDMAIESKLEESFKKGVPVPIGTKDLLQASKKHRASTKEWFNTAKNYALFSNESGLYDDILDYLKIKK